MNIDTLCGAFADALSEIIATVSGVSLDTSADDNKFDGMVSMMGLNRGVLFISAGEQSMRVLCSFMTGVGFDGIMREDMRDALCELVNMTAGNIKLRISDPDYMFALTPPFIIDGDNMSLITKKRVRAVSRKLSDVTGGVCVRLKIVY